MNTMIKVNNISFSYGKNSVLSNCSFELPDNSMTALLGCNGQGKTTLMNCILNYSKISEGSIELKNKNIRNLTVNQISRLVSYVPQLTEYTSSCVVRDFLVEGRTPYLSTFQIPSEKEYAIVEDEAKKLGLEDLLNKKLDEISGGQKQMILILRALIQDTPFIMMDEPMSALDLNNQKKVLNLLKILQNEGKTILFTTHNPNHALFLNCNCLVLKTGKIIQSGIASDILDQNTISELYGDSINITDFGGKKICYF